LIAAAYHTDNHLIATAVHPRAGAARQRAQPQHPEHTHNHRQGSNTSVDIDSSSVWFGALTPFVEIAQRANCRFTCFVMDATDLTDRVILESQHSETLVISQQMITRSAARLGFALHLSSSSKQPRLIVIA
jgi:hypothetical protein